MTGLWEFGMPNNKHLSLHVTRLSHWENRLTTSIGHQIPPPSLQVLPTTVESKSGTLRLILWRLFSVTLTKMSQEMILISLRLRSSLAGIRLFYWRVLSKARLVFTARWVLSTFRCLRETRSIDLSAPSQRMNSTAQITTRTTRVKSD